MNEFAKRLQRAMDLSGVKQVDLAGRTGIGKSSICTYLQGEYLPKQANIAKLAKALNVSEAWLYGGDVPMERAPLHQSADYSPVRSCMIPVLGQVAAGLGSLAYDNIESYHPVSAELVPPSEQEDHFYLVVRGESMTPELLPEDLVLVKKQASLPGGSLGVFLIDGEEGVVKRVRYGKGFIELLSVNPYFPPRRFEGIEQARVQVVGKVVSSLRIY